MLSRLKLVTLLSLGLFYPNAYASDKPLEEEYPSKNVLMGIPLEIWPNILFHTSPHFIVEFSTVNQEAYRQSRKESLWELLFSAGKLATSEEVGDAPFDRTCFQIYVSQCFYKKGMSFLFQHRFDEAYMCFVNGAYGGHRICPFQIGKLLNSKEQFNWQLSLIPPDPIKAFFDREFNNLEKTESAYKNLAEYYDKQNQRDLAFPYHRAAANRGSLGSMYRVGCSCLTLGRCSEEVLYWFHRSCSSTLSLEYLCEIYSNGWVDTMNELIAPRPERIELLLAQAELGGNKLAAYKLALLNENYTQAWDILQSLNKQQYKVLYTFAQAYEEGLSDFLKIDLDTAAEYYYQSAIEGYSHRDADTDLNKDLLRLAGQGNQKAQEYLDLLDAEESSD